MSLFRKRVPFEAQLAALADLGIAPNPGVEEDDLFMFHTRAELEKAPYKDLVETMAMEIEREPWTPITDPLWMCDHECIEDHGDYASVVQRLERMTGRALELTDIQDHVDVFEEGAAWVRFELRGTPVKWDMSVNDDWLDPTVLSRYDQLLAGAGSEIRLYRAAGGDYGQSDLLVALTEPRREALSGLTGIRLVPVL